MDEWKNLEIDNLPPDILTGGYYFEFKNGANWRWWDRDIKDLIYYLLKENYKFRYRKSEPKQPTHEEILQRLKKELNIQLDTKIADMKKTITWHMNYLYDCLKSEAE